MAVTKNIIGQYVNLKSADADDAEFTMGIRKDPEFIKYLPEIDNTIEEQQQWITKQRSKSDDYFFVVWNKNNERIGTISVFDLNNNPPKSGRLALKGNALQNIEAQYLTFDFAFNTLNTEKLWSFIYADNHRAIRFAETFGVTIGLPSIDESGREIREVMFYKNDFLAKVPQIRKMLYREIMNKGHL